MTQIIQAKIHLLLVMEQAEFIFGVLNGNKQVQLQPTNQ